MLKQLKWGRFCSIWEVSHWEYRMNRTGSFDNWTCYQILLIKHMREYELILAKFQNSRDLNIYSIACSFRWMLGIPQCIRFINLCQSGLVIVMDVNTTAKSGKLGTRVTKAKTKQCFVGGFCFRCTFPFRKTTSVFYTQFKRQTILFWKAAYPVGKTPLGNYIAKWQK